MPASTYSANIILDQFLRGVAFVAPSRIWLSLHTADPGVSGANEVTAGAWPAYARQDPAQGAAIATGFSAAATKATANAKEMLFPGHDGAADITVTHFGIWDAATAGNLLFYGALTASKTLHPTDEIVVKATELDISVD